MPRRFVAVAVAVAAFAAALAVNAASSGEATKLKTTLNGRNEVPAAPASNRGTVQLTLTPSSGKVCWKFALAKIDGMPLQAHIHKGAKGVSGPVVVPLYAHGKLYLTQGCTIGKKSIVAAVAKRPRAYYVNVHNAKHPAGAMRGQLVLGT